jgi:hypothetical protein
MQHIQDIWILLMASEQATALSEFGHQPGVIHVTPALSSARTPGRYFRSIETMQSAKALSNKSFQRLGRIELKIIFKTEQY